MLKGKKARDIRVSMQNCRDGEGGTTRFAAVYPSLLGGNCNDPKREESNLRVRTRNLQCEERKRGETKVRTCRGKNLTNPEAHARNSSPRRMLKRGSRGRSKVGSTRNVFSMARIKKRATKRGRTY